MSLDYLSHSPIETMDFASQLTSLLKANCVVALTGTLGAGKTTFTKGVARALEVTEAITSPTFTLIQEYEGKIPLYHMDLYRLESVEEFERLGAEEYFYRDGITIIEWSEKAEEILPLNTLYIHLSVDSQCNRHISIKGGALSPSELNIFNQQLIEMIQSLSQ